MSAPSPSAPRAPTIDVAFVRRIADLARLEVDAESLPALTEQFARILDLVSTVQRIDAAGHDPATQEPVGVEALRDDVPGPTLSRREVSGNAPAHDGAFLVVPKFLGGEE
jgi:aspartyl-tRNA(Asn)/glutamyl-tRNA(Gln) amidotransferase subunit C